MLEYNFVYFINYWNHNGVALSEKTNALYNWAVYPYARARWPSERLERTCLGCNVFLLSSWPTDPSGVTPRSMSPFAWCVHRFVEVVFYVRVRPVHSSGTVLSADQRHCQCLRSSLYDTESAITFELWQNGRWDSTWIFFCLHSVFNTISPFL